MTEGITYRLRNSEFAPFITARVVSERYYPFKDNKTIYEVEVTDSRKPAHIQTTYTPIWDAKLFHLEFAWDSWDGR